ncbi:MAG: M56 family metallopeptidase [Pseudomonadota bacterium]
MTGSFAGWAIEALIASTLLMGFVLLVRRRARDAFGAQLAYWLWALPVLRMVMPPLPAAWRESTAAPISAASETLLVYVQPVANMVVAAPSLSPLAVAAALWLAGAIGFFGWHGLSHLSYVRRIVSPPARHRPLADGTTLVESDEAIGPVAFGVLRRFVAVPRDFAERYDEDERALALAHELGHHARGDLIANWIALAMLAVHWFNPLAWVAYRKFRGDQEMANDARVLAALPPIQRHAYACAIVKAAHGRAVTAACHLHTIEDLKGRLKMLKVSRKSRRVVMAGAAGIAGLTLAGLGLTASGAAAEQIRSVAATIPVLATPVELGPVAPVPPMPSVPAVGAKKKIVIIRDGKTETYEGAEADAYIKTHPDMTAPGNGTRRHRIVIKRDGKTESYEGAEAEAYIKAHPDMMPPAPLPPIPPLAGAVGAPPLAPLPPVPGVVITTSDDGRTIVKHVARGGPGGYAYAFGTGPTVTSGDCGKREPGKFVIDGDKDGKRGIIICEQRIERYAEANAMRGLRSGLDGLNAGRRAIIDNRNLTEDQREQALAGIEQARKGIEEALREERRKK